MGIVHRMTDEELPGVLGLLAAGGGTARTLETWAADRMTSLVLGEVGNPLAVMPLARRRVRVTGGAPGREVAAGWISSNQFASRMGWRRQTRATAPEWAGLLPDVDVLLVMRRDESSLSARWYGQTGFEDVLSVRCLYLDMEAPPAGGGSRGRYHVQVIGPGEEGFGRWEEQMLGVYADVFGSYGGPRVRGGGEVGGGPGVGFWSEALRFHYYRDHYQFQVIGLWESPSAGAGAGAAGGLVGYAVVGWSGWHSKRPRMDILELATRQWDTGVAAELIQTTCQLAWSKNVRQVRAVISAHDPYRGHLMRTGFEDRWGYVMLAKWLHPQRYLERIAGGTAGAGGLPGELGEVRMELRVPGTVPLTLVRGKGSEALRVEGSARIVTRLLLNRLEIGAAVQDGSLRGVDGVLGEGDVAKLSAAFPWTPWAFHMVDYI